MYVVPAQQASCHPFSGAGLFWGSPETQIRCVPSLIQWRRGASNRIPKQWDKRRPSAQQWTKTNSIWSFIYRTKRLYTVIPALHGTNRHYQWCRTRPPLSPYSRSSRCRPCTPDLATCRWSVTAHPASKEISLESSVLNSKIAIYTVIIVYNRL